ncbi:DUF115 domain-containing protein [Leptospira biflexa]|uniref:6-hydroxymethylpterin diphosphokinase MptE-like protein n=1 Tax=Leptospira biflexa TaxID=172 RepID=UPI00108460A8|nr:6-hydroxymethylpterin diphosphokinase MptE-like protein [Leptospira biflexa]TGM31789.1 DUF115 domain-containing protein [Leptospira biflexa]TGM36931.1 DUF115 domain-containing protein [Leptospira biflexa]TGM46467.1 DUF115 domain-containing protein [Leptospira biflexa]TGM51071.1 DUF115 domain-containing protein [Leptospira biflexa]
MGVGALHSVRALIESPKTHPFFFFWEPNSEIFLLSEFQIETKELIQKAKNKGIFLQIITGKTPDWAEINKELVTSSLSDQELNLKWTLYETPNYERLFPDLVKESRHHFLSQFRSQSTNENTIQHFRKLWTHNHLKNQLSLKKDQNKFHWFQSFAANHPNVLFVGASPSLESDLETIKRHRNNWSVFVSDTALGFLLENDITPDYIVSFDSGRGTTYHFLLEIPIHIPIITWLGGSPYLFELPNPKILVNTGHPLDQILAFLLQKEQSILWPHYQNPSLNLFGMVLSITNGIQNRNFTISGVSFVSEQGKSHCKGTGYERFYSPLVNRKQSLEISTKRLYSGVRKGKNQVVWEELVTAKDSKKIQLLSELTTFQTNMIEPPKKKLHSFQGFPPKISDLAKWANQDQSGIIHAKTLNTWLRFSPG